MTEFDAIYARMAEVYAQTAGFSPDDASDAALRLRAVAGELYTALCMLENVRRDAFPETAVGEALEQHAVQRGLQRKAAQPSVGALTFSRDEALTYDVEIPLGSVCASSGAAAEYETTARAVLKAGEKTVTAAARSVQGGRRYNAAAAAIDTLVTPPAGIERVTNTAPFAGGADAENDDALRRRLLQSYSVLPNGSNSETYRRAALAVPGVKSAAVVPREDGTGTVSVYIYGDGAPVLESVRAQVERVLSAMREVNVTVTVGAAEAVPRNFSSHITAAEDCDFASAKALCEAAVDDVFARYTVGEAFRVADMVAAMMQTGAVQNVRIPPTGADYVTAANEIVTKGTVTLMNGGAGT